MPAEPVRKPEPQHNVLYVIPPWAERKVDRDPFRERVVTWFRGVCRSDTARALAIEAQFLALVVTIGVCLYVVLPDVYRLKSKAGIDLVPGIHGPDVFPFLGK
jgi:hypothetical protein